MRSHTRFVIALAVIILDGFFIMIGRAYTSKFVSKWGSIGTGDGQFNQPWGIAVNGTGHVYITDAENDRVQVFTATGQFVNTWGSTGTGDGRFSYPAGIVVNATGYVYVVDYENNRVQVFTATGQFVTKWGSYGAANGQFDQPHSILINDSGYVYVSDIWNERVQIFTSTGQFVGKWGSPGSGDGQFNFPVGIALSPTTGYVYVTDYYNDRVQVFTAAGQFVTKWSGGLDGPRGIAINGTGQIYVADMFNNRVQVFSSTGTSLGKWGSTGTGDGQFQHPHGVAVNQTGMVYVTDIDNNRVQVFENSNSINGFPDDWVLWTVLCIISVIVVAAIVVVVKRRERPVAPYVQRKELIRPSPDKAPRPEVFIQASPAYQDRVQNAPAQFVQRDAPAEQARRPACEIKRQYEYVSGKVRVKVKVSNTTQLGLLRMQVNLQVPASFHLLYTEPQDYRREGTSVNIGDLLPGEAKTLAWILEPLICGKESLMGTVTGANSIGKPFAVAMDPLEIEVRCPMFALPEEINLAAVQRIIGDLAVRNERVFFLPVVLSPPDALEVAQRAIALRDVRHVGTLDTPGATGFDRVAWYYGMTKVGRGRYVLTASVSETDRTIRITSACDDEAGCTGFLAEAGVAIRRELVIRGAITSEEGIVELTCEKCGATLPRAPIVGRDVSCPECHWTWRVSDYFR